MELEKCFCGLPLYHPIEFINDMGIPKCNYFAILCNADQTGEDVDGGAATTEGQSVLNMTTYELSKIVPPEDDTLCIEDSHEDKSPFESFSSHNMSTCKDINCLTCEMTTSLRESMLKDPVGGVLPLKKKIQSKDKKKEDTKKTKTTDIIIEPIDVSIRSIATKIYDVLKQKPDLNSISLQEISNIYFTQPTRLSPENYKKMVTTLVTLLKYHQTPQYGVHPLTKIRSNNQLSSVKSAIAELDTIADDSGYHALIDLSMFQSVGFNDICDLEHHKLFYGGPLNSIHPIFVALFGIKLSGIEDTGIKGDSYTLLKQLYHGGSISDTNGTLVNSRFNDSTEDKIYMSNTSDEFSAEIQRASIHMALRKIAVKIRNGDFRDISFKPGYWIKKMKNHHVTKSYKQQEEIILEMSLRILAHKSFYIKDNQHGIASCPYVIFPMKDVTELMNCDNTINGDIFRFIEYDNFRRRFEIKTNKHIQPLVITTTPGLNPYLDTQYQINGHGHIGSNMYHPTQVYGMPQPQHIPGSGITGSGTIIIFIERNKEPRTIDAACFSYSKNIHATPINIDTKIVTPQGSTYDLKSAVCYRPDSFSVGLGQDISEKSPSFTIVFTEKGPWLYDPYESITKHTREQTLDRILKNTFESDPANQGLIFDDWKTDPINKPIIDEVKNKVIDGKLTIEDSIISHDEAQNLLVNYSYILIYSQDAELYKADNKSNMYYSPSVQGCCLI